MRITLESQPLSARTTAARPRCAAAYSAGGYLFVYAIVYARSELQLHGAAAPVLYYGYMGAASLGVALMTGTVGFAAAYAFVYHIYAAVKVD